MITDYKLQLEQLMFQPKEAITNYDLFYTHEEDLSIIRKKKGKGFMYFIEGKRISKKTDIKRIKSLVIPPMWKQVRISINANSHLQAVGRDAKNRKQYLYHPDWNKIRNTTKFYKMYSFGQKLPIIRKQIDKDLNRSGWPKEKVVALVIRLMEETQIRIGNSYYEKENKTYGLTTLRKKHVNIYKGKMKIEFVGKKGKEHCITVRNKKIIRLVNRCEEIPGWKLFKFIDDNGDKKSIESNHINDYLQMVCGKKFTAKDFRTWSASVSFFNALMESTPAISDKELKQNILKGYEFAAATLGNTKNVCRKYYVHPVIVEAYQEGKLNKTFEKVKRSRAIAKYFSPSEKEILKLFKNYIPNL